MTEFVQKIERVHCNAARILHKGPLVIEIVLKGGFRIMELTRVTLLCPHFFTLVTFWPIIPLSHTPLYRSHSKVIYTILMVIAC